VIQFRRDSDFHASIIFTIDSIEMWCKEDPLNSATHQYKVSLKYINIDIFCNFPSLQSEQLEINPEQLRC
jgi:hypothetical protein